MSGLTARWALLAARTASSAGTVMVGSAIDFSARALRDVARRDDPTRTRTVVPAAEAALARVFLPLVERPPSAEAAVVVRDADRPPLAVPRPSPSAALVRPLVVLWRFGLLGVAIVPVLLARRPTLRR